MRWVRQFREESPRWYICQVHCVRQIRVKRRWDGALWLAENLLLATQELYTANSARLTSEKSRHFFAHVGKNNFTLHMHGKGVFPRTSRSGNFFPCMCKEKYRLLLGRKNNFHSCSYHPSPSARDNNATLVKIGFIPSCEIYYFLTRAKIATFLGYIRGSNSAVFLPMTSEVKNTMLVSSDWLSAISCFFRATNFVLLEKHLPFFLGF